MQIQSESRIAHPRDEVYRTYRDRLPELVPFIPDIKRITELARSEEQGVVRLHNEWMSSREVPSFASAFIKPEQLAWDDYAEWNGEGTSWKIVPRAFTEVVSCTGRTTFVADGAGETVVTLLGELSLDLRKMKSVPNFLAGRIGPQVERFIVSLIQPNLEQVNRSIGRFLDARG